MDHTSKITISNCKRCKFYLGPIKKQFFAQNCEDCEFTVITNEFKLENVTNSTVFVYTNCNPVIENCSGITFAPFNMKYPNLKAHCQKANICLDPLYNEWYKIQKYAQRAPVTQNIKLKDSRNLHTKSIGIKRFILPGAEEEQNDIDNNFAVEIPNEYQTNQVIDTQFLITIDSDAENGNLIVE